jgi:hypothetical protein
MMREKRADRVVEESRERQVESVAANRADAAEAFDSSRSIRRALFTFQTAQFHQPAFSGRESATTRTIRPNRHPSKPKIPQFSRCTVLKDCSSSAASPAKSIDQPYIMQKTLVFFGRVLAVSMRSSW